MNSAKIKSVFIFIILTSVLFYFNNLIARESTFTIEDTEQSAQFLDIVAVLNDIQFDLDFVGSLGDTVIKTDVYIQPLSPSDAGRDNPFRKSNPSVLFESPQDVFSGQGEVRAIIEGEVPSPGLSDSQLLVEEQGTAVLLEEGQDFIVPTDEGRDEGPEELLEPSSATLTR